jgi:hypothetical protein
MKIEIKCRFSGNVLFAHEAENNSIRITLEAAVSTYTNLDGANLVGANLDGANLDGAYLAGANLVGANLAGANLGGAYLARANLGGANLGGAYLVGANLGGANLGGAYLVGANLDGANLDGAYLAGANLVGANLAGANLARAKLIGGRPVFQVGPIGSRCDYLISYLTDCGVKIRAGCFFGSLDEFVSSVKETHRDNEHAREYMAAVSLIQAHAAIWTPMPEEKAA